MPVSPGTRFVTIGGAIASDIHGKNHHVDGTFGRHVRRLTLLLADGSTVDVGPDRHAELFWATVGGMGLTGVVVQATFSMLRIETSQMTVDTERADDLDHLLDLMTSGDDRYRYSVAWIDLLARGKALGRSVLTRGDHARVEELAPHQAVRPLEYQPGHLATVPAMIPGRGLLNHTTIAAFNELWFRAAPRRRIGEIVAIPRYFHPLDAIGAWNRLYGRRGLVQYQILVPFGAEEALRRVVTRLADSGTPSFLSVLKRFGAANPAPLSFPAPGWTLTLDIPAAVDGLAGLLAELDDVVLDAGGRHYLAKDAVASPDAIRRGYPRLAEWQAIRRRSRSARPLGERSEPPAAPHRAVRATVMDNALGEAQTIVLFGGTSEIGRAIVDVLVSPATTTVVLAVRRPDEVDAAALRGRGVDVDVVPFDATDIDEHERLVRRLTDAHGDLDVVIVAFGQLGDAAQLADDGRAAAALVDVNFTGAVSVCTVVAAQFRRQGHGRLVVLSSVAGERVRKANYVYGASKAGLDGFAQGLGDTLAGTGASVLIVRPGFVHTKMTAGRKAQPLSTSPEAVAAATVKALRAGRRIVWVPPAVRPLMMVARHLPAQVWRRVSN